VSAPTWLLVVLGAVPVVLPVLRRAWARVGPDVRRRWPRAGHALDALAAIAPDVERAAPALLAVATGRPWVPTTAADIPAVHDPPRETLAPPSPTERLP